MSLQPLIKEFLSQQRFAFAGVSRDPKDFSRSLLAEFLQRGYHVAIVNPFALEINNLRCFHTLQEVTPRVHAALLMGPKDLTVRLVRNCIEAGISIIWIHGIGGPKNIPHEALRACELRGIKVIPGYCPFMFLEETGRFHRWHGQIMKLTGSYPS